MEGGVFSRLCRDDNMSYVKAGPGDTSDSLIRKFTKKVLAEGIIQEMKDKEYYLKPSLKKKLKRQEAARRRRIKYVA